MSLLVSTSEICADCITLGLCLLSIITITSNSPDARYAVGNKIFNAFTTTYSCTILLIGIKYFSIGTLIYLQTVANSHIQRRRIRMVGRFLSVLTCLFFSLFLGSGLMTFLSYISSSINFPAHFYIWLYCLCYNTAELGSSTIRFRQFLPFYAHHGAEIHVNRRSSSSLFNDQNRYNDMNFYNEGEVPNDACILKETIYNPDDYIPNSDVKNNVINIHQNEIKDEENDNKGIENKNNKHLITNNNLEHQESCVICMETFQMYDRIITLECNHIYHSQCIIEWIVRSSSCPKCRATLPQQIYISQSSNDEDNIV